MIRAFIAAALWLPTAAVAFELKRDSTGEPVRWEGRADFVIDQRAADALGEPLAFAAAQAAIETMDQGSPGLVLSLRSGPTLGVGYDLEEPSRNRSEIVFPSEWSYDKGSIAVTVLSVDIRAHRILDADIAFNPARKFKVLPRASDGSEYDDIQNTLTHELGHALGLAHDPDQPEAVMYPLALRGEVNKRVLAADDLQGLAFLYPAPGDEPATRAEPEVGCAQGAGALAPSAVLALATLLSRRARKLPRAGKAGPGRMARGCVKLRGDAPCLAGLCGRAPFGCDAGLPR